MKKTFSISAVIVCGLWGVSQAMADVSYCDSVATNLVANCGFERGDFTGWTLSGNTTNPGGNYFGVDTFDAYTGNYGAYMSQDFVDGGTAPVNLSQTLATNAGNSYTIEFWLEQDTGPTTGYAHAFSATWGGATLLSLTPTVAVPGPVGVFTEYSFTETAATASTVLNFAFENDDNYWSIDDVVVTPAVPEPTGILLLGTVTFLLGWKLQNRMA